LFSHHEVLAVPRHLGLQLPFLVLSVLLFLEPLEDARTLMRAPSREGLREVIVRACMSPGDGVDLPVADTMMTGIAEVSFALLSAAQTSKAVLLGQPESKDDQIGRLAADRLQPSSPVAAVSRDSRSERRDLEQVHHAAVVVHDENRALLLPSRVSRIGFKPSGHLRVSAPISVGSLCVKPSWGAVSAGWWRPTRADRSIPAPRPHRRGSRDAPGPLRRSPRPGEGGCPAFRRVRRRSCPARSRKSRSRSIERAPQFSAMTCRAFS